MLKKLLEPRSPRGRRGGVEESICEPSPKFELIEHPNSNICQEPMEVSEILEDRRHAFLVALR